MATLINNDTTPKGCTYCGAAFVAAKGRPLLRFEIPRSLLTSEPVCIRCAWQHKAAIFRCDTEQDLQWLRANPTHAYSFALDKS